MGCRLRFHRPPFNSVDHLHLHVVCEPFLSPFSESKFRKGSAWAASIEEIIAEVKSGQSPGAPPTPVVLSKVASHRFSDSDQRMRSRGEAAEGVLRSDDGGEAALAAPGCEWADVP